MPQPRNGGILDGESIINSVPKERSAVPSAPLPAKNRRIAQTSLGANSRGNPSSTAFDAGETVQQLELDPFDPNGSWGDRRSLHRYRYAQQLSIPSAFSNSLNQRTLVQPGLAQMSPTMARHKEKRRVSKERVAAAVKNDFDATHVSEQDVIGAFIHAVHRQESDSKGKTF